MEDAQKKIAEVVFHRENPTVEEYCENWLLMRSGTVRTNTLEGLSLIHISMCIRDSIGGVAMSRNIRVSEPSAEMQIKIIRVKDAIASQKPDVYKRQGICSDEY